MVDYFDKNFGPGKLFPGGPTWKFLGRDIPCMMRWSQKESITSHILADALKHIDSFNMFERKDEKSHSSFWIGIIPDLCCHSLNTLLIKVMNGKFA